MKLKLPRGWPLILAAIIGATVVTGAEAVIKLLHSGGPSSDVLALVDGKPITLQAFENEMNQRGGEAAFSGPDQRRALLDDMIRVSVLAADAQKAGYADDPEVRRGVQQLLADKYEREAIDAPLANLQVSDSEIENYYRAHIAAFTTPESVHAAVIFIAVPAKASEDERRVLQQRAQHVREMTVANAGRNFAELATQYSDDQATRLQGGDAGWLEAGQGSSRWDPTVTGAIFDLNTEGAVSPLITTPTGLYVVKILERKPEVARPLGEVRNGIRQQLIRSERQHRAAKLYADALAKVPVNVNEAGVAAMEAAEKAATDLPHGSAPQPKG